MKNRDYRFLKNKISFEYSLERNNMKLQGVFDGRYNTRSVPSKKLYKRNTKHKKKYK